MKRLVRSREADSDVEQALDYYIAEAAVMAGPFVDELEKAFAHIRRHPGTGSPRYAHELDLPGLRSWPLKRFPYLVFYMEQPDRILVVRVLHSHQDIPVWLQAPPLE